MPNFTRNGIVSQVAFSSLATPVAAVGTLAVTADGRKYRYVKAGGLLVAGNALQAPVEDVDHDDITCRATDAGSTSLLITTGSGSGNLDLNEYADGYAVVDTTPGLGYVYRIKSHLAIAASTNGSLELYPEDPIQVALTSSSRVTLIKNPYNGVIQMPATTLTNAIVGGAIYPIASGEYGWIQTGGQGAALISGTPGAGQPITVSGTAGALAVHSAELPNVAYMMVTGRTGKCCPVFWTLE